MTLSFSPDGRRLVAGAAENTAKIWDVQLARSCKSSEDIRGRLGDGLQPRPRGPLGRLGRRGQHRENLGQPRWQVSPQLSWPHRHRQQPGVQPNGGMLITGSRDKTVKIWDLSHLNDGGHDR